MPRSINRLNSKKVEHLKTPGRHADGGNLYLSVSPAGARSWVFIFRWEGKQRELGFGSARNLTLARARELAAAARAKLGEGIAPTNPKRPSGGITFGEVADKLVEAMKPSWRSDAHARQWELTLGEYAAPLRKLPVGAVATEDVLSVLKPLWNDRHETAVRLRGRLEKVLAAAEAQGLRSGKNPATWRNHLDQLLPKRQRLQKKHLAAMAYAEVPAFMQQLRKQSGISPLALEFLVLTAARTDEVLDMRWPEVDLNTGLWTAPPEHMKGGVEHQVPLSPRAIEILHLMEKGRQGEFVFPGRKRSSRLSSCMLLETLRNMGVEGATVHGFRSSFRDWAGDCTHYPREVVEAALAHVIENKAEAAYRRGTAIEKRRELMRAWDVHCGTPPSANVILLRKETGGARAVG
jgi:integrase